MTVTRLQGVVASIEAPSEDYKNEIRDQVMPDPAAVNKLRAKLDVFKKDLAEVKAQSVELEQMREELKLQPDLVDTLVYLKLMKGYKIGIVTNNQDSGVEIFLEKLDLALAHAGQN